MERMVNQHILKSDCRNSCSSVVTAMIIYLYVEFKVINMAFPCGTWPRVAFPCGTWPQRVIPGYSGHCSIVGVSRTERLGGQSSWLVDRPGVLGHLDGPHRYNFPLRQHCHSVA